jgi:hypothetical protein
MLYPCLLWNNWNNLCISWFERGAVRENTRVVLKFPSWPVWSRIKLNFLRTWSVLPPFFDTFSISLRYRFSLLLWLLAIDTSGLLSHFSSPLTALASLSSPRGTQMIDPSSDFLVISPWTNLLPIALSSFLSPGSSFAIVSAYLFSLLPYYCSIRLFRLF